MLLPPALPFAFRNADADVDTVPLVPAAFCVADKLCGNNAPPEPSIGPVAPVGGQMSPKCGSDAAELSMESG